MTIKAIYFKDEGFTHVKLCNLYPRPDHLLINGVVVKPESINGDNYLVEGDKVVVKGAKKCTYISHYLNRETEEKLSVHEYNMRLASFKDERSCYKDLESEYMYRKMQQMYVAVQEAYYEYEEVPVCFEEAELNPDKYTKCSGRVFNSLSGKEKEGHFIYTFDKWTFANDTIKRLMEEHGIPRISSRHDAGDMVEYYVLHDSSDDYCWLELCGNEFFLTHETVFGRSSDIKPLFYGTYDEIRTKEKELEAWFRKCIENKLDCVRTVKVRKSSMSELKEKLRSLSKRINNKELNRSRISSELNSILYNIDIMVKEK